MKLIHTGTSPYVRKVMVAAHELGLAGRIETTFLRPNPTRPDPELSKLNPLSKIPALVTDEGRVVYDSRVICEYLQSLAGAEAQKLTPPSGPERWEVLRRAALCDGILEAAILVFYERDQRPKELHWEPWISGQESKARQGLDALEAEVDTLSGDVDLAHIGVGVTVGWLLFRKHLGDVLATRPRLAAWYARFSERPSMLATVPRL